MKREYLSFFLVFLVVLIFVASDFAASARSPQTEKPKEDYMTTILSRNTFEPYTTENRFAPFGGINADGSGKLYFADCLNR